MVSCSKSSFEYYKIKQINSTWDNIKNAKEWNTIKKIKINTYIIGDKNKNKDLMSFFIPGWNKNGLLVKVINKDTIRTVPSLKIKNSDKTPFKYDSIEFRYNTHQFVIFKYDNKFRVSG